MKITSLKITNALLFALLVLSVSCKKGGNYREMQGMIWNTTYNVIWNGSASLSDSVAAAMQQVDKSLNMFNEKSIVSIVNASPTGHAVDEHFRRVWEKSRDLHRRSNGAFDPTLSPLITAWGFGKGHKATTDTTRLDSLLSITGFEKTSLRNDSVIKADPRIVFNFSAIAKGYGCDNVAEMFRRNGVTDFMIEIGGEIVCSGKSPRGDDWRISIDRPIMNPNGISHESQTIINVTGKGIATSGNYRNFHGEGANAYGHTISSKTGRPEKTDVLSATVIAPTCAEADGLATACMALGSKEALKLCNSENVPVMLILADKVLETESFKQVIQKK